MTTDPKYLPIARRVMNRFDAGDSYFLPAPARRGMIRELGLTGVVLSPDRADSYVVSRYVATFGATRSDAWSDEARAAALEARQASAHANKEKSQTAHYAAAKAHLKAAAAKRSETALAKPEQLQSMSNSAAGHEASAEKHATAAGYHIRETEIGPHLFPTASSSAPLTNARRQKTSSDQSAPT